MKTMSIADAFDFEPTASDLGVVLRAEKGSPLTIEDMDTNFKRVAAVTAFINLVFGGNVILENEIFDEADSIENVTSFTLPHGSVVAIKGVSGYKSVDLGLSGGGISYKYAVDINGIPFMFQDETQTSSQPYTIDFTSWSYMASVFNGKVNPDYILIFNKDQSADVDITFSNLTPKTAEQ